MNRIARILPAALVALGLLAPPAAAQGQLPALTQTFDYDGQWAIDFPGGWVTDDTGFPVLASIPSAVGTLIQNDPLPVNTMAIGIIPPETNALLGVTPEATLAEAVTRVAAIYGRPGVEVLPFETTAGEAVMASLAGSTRMPGGSNLIALDHDGTTFVFLVVVGDLAAATPLLQAILATLR